MTAITNKKNGMPSYIRLQQNGFRMIKYFNENQAFPLLFNFPQCLTDDLLWTNIHHNTCIDKDMYVLSMRKRHTPAL